MKIITLRSESFRANTYICISRGEAAIIDPAQPEERIEAALAREDARPTLMLLTHGHYDHVLSADHLRRKYYLPLLINERDMGYPEDGHKNASIHLLGYEQGVTHADLAFKDGDTFPLGDELIRACSTPGHTGGCTCFIAGEALISGDTVFASCPGRTDLVGSDIRELMASIEYIYRSIPAEYKLLPGHGEASTVGQAVSPLTYPFLGRK